MEAPMGLARLPDELLVVLLCDLPLRDIANASAVCRSWYLDCDRIGLWAALGHAYGVKLPRAGPNRQSTRQSSNPKMAFFKSVTAKNRADKALLDRIVWSIWLNLHRRDCAGFVRRAMANSPGRFGHRLLTHRLAFYGGRSLAMLAAWRGRLRTLKLVHAHAGLHPLTEEDDHGFSPLAFAAWAGHRHVVMWLVAQEGINLTASGTPPMTSSCGGRGPYTADVWAERKGFHDIADLIRRVVASRGRE
eukprot:m.202447 g.202447  ORF g.202447 m.202447 type:complete len:247 (-) comp21775_c0_seq1:192-932(-)